MENKSSFGPDFGPNSDRQIFFFFFLNLASSVTKSEKTNDPMSRKPSDRQMDRLTRVISLDTVRLTSSVQQNNKDFCFPTLYIF